MDRILNMFELTEERFLKNCAHYGGIRKKYVEN